MQAVSFEETIEVIASSDPRYHSDAYFFVREALDFTQKQIERNPRDQAHHITGKELLEGVRTYGTEQFGPMTLTVLNEWGVKNCEDFGEIVFNMVESNLLAKTEKDSREDFKDGYDFDAAFRKPYLPPASPPFTPEPKSTQVG